MYYLFSIIATGTLAVLLVTPAVKSLAIRWKIVDQPDGRRKLHSRITPLGGGISIYLGSIIALFFSSFVVGRIWPKWPFEDTTFLLSMAAGSLCLVLVGLIDDSKGIRGRHKLLAQIFASSIIVLSGLIVENIQVFNWNIELGILAIPFTIFWIVGAINAVNLIDGIDGLATSVGMVLSFAIALMALMVNRNLEALIALSMAGSLLGFLFFNFPPAKMFLGDSGSMLIGLVLGTLAISCSFKGPATIALAIPLTILAIPVMDVSMAILRRRLTGRSIYSTDRGHLHHVFQQKGYGNKRTVMMIVILCACTATGAIISEYYDNEFLAVGTVLLVVSILVFTRMFGHAEMSLLFNRARAFAVSLLRGVPQHEPVQQIRSRIQGSQEWDVLWESLIAYAQRFKFTKVILNITVPSLHEEFHAEWKMGKEHGNDDEWSFSIPIVADDHYIAGRLRMTSIRVPGDSCDDMGELIAGLKPFETQMHELLEEIEADLQKALELENEETPTPASEALPAQEENIPTPVVASSQTSDDTSAV